MITPNNSSRCCALALAPFAQHITAFAPHGDGLLGAIAGNEQDIQNQRVEYYRKMLFICLILLVYCANCNIKLSVSVAKLETD